MLLLNVEAKWKRTQSGDEPVHRAFLMLFNSARRYHTEERHMIYCDAEMNESIWRLDSHGPPWHDRIPAVIGRRTGPLAVVKIEMEAWMDSEWPAWGTDGEEVSCTNEKLNDGTALRFKALGLKADWFTVSFDVDRIGKWKHQRGRQISFIMVIHGIKLPFHWR